MGRDCGCCCSNSSLLANDSHSRQRQSRPTTKCMESNFRGVCTRLTLACIMCRVVQQLLALGARPYAENVPAHALSRCSALPAISAPPAISAALLPVSIVYTYTYTYIYTSVIPVLLLCTSALASLIPARCGQLRPAPSHLVSRSVLPLNMA